MRLSHLNTFFPFRLPYIWTAFDITPYISAEPTDTYTHRTHRMTNTCPFGKLYLPIKGSPLLPNSPSRHYPTYQFNKTNANQPLKAIIITRRKKMHPNRSQISQHKKPDTLYSAFFFFLLLLYFSYYGYLWCVRYRCVDDDDENHPRLPSAPKWIFMLWELGRGTCSHDFFSMLSHMQRGRKQRRRRCIHLIYKQKL